MKFEEQQWTLLDRSHKRNSFNSEIIALRAYRRNNQKCVRLNIGRTVGSLVDIKKGDRINVYSNKDNRNLLLVRKSFSPLDGYKVSQSTPSAFLTIDFVFNFREDFHLSQTISVRFDVNEDKSISIDLAKLLTGFEKIG